MWKFWKSGKSGSSRYLDFLIAQEFVNPMSGNRVYGRIWLLSLDPAGCNLTLMLSHQTCTRHTHCTICPYMKITWWMCVRARMVFVVFCVFIRWGSGAILFFFHVASIFAARGSADMWMDWLGVPQSHRAPPRTSGGGVDMSVCGCVWVWETCKGFERIVFCVFFVCFSVGKLSSGALVVYDNQYNSRFWPGVECWSCFSLRHRNGLSEIQFSTPSELFFSVGRLQVCLVAFSIACAVAGARYGGSEEGTPTIVYVIFLIILLVLHIWECFQFCELLFFSVARIGTPRAAEHAAFGPLRPEHRDVCCCSLVFCSWPRSWGEGRGPRRGRGRSDHHRRWSGFPCGWLVCFRVVEQSLVPPLPGLWVNASRVLPLLLPSGFPIEHCRLSRQGDFPVPRLPPPEVSSLRIPALFLDVIFLFFSHFENLLQIFVDNFFTFVKCLTH